MKPIRSFRFSGKVPPGRKTPTTAPDSSGAFERFDAFTRQLMAVPKAEIDRKEAEYLKKKAVRKKRKRK